jgi:hypothetical protein
MFGTWGVDDRAKDIDGDPFEIPEHGLGFFAARRESWLGFHPDFSGFSGGEGYIHEKYRQAGRKVLCLPGVRWYHKFSRPHGIPHRPTVEDKIKNHVRGWTELGVDLATGETEEPCRSICEHYVGGVGERNNRGIISFERFVSLCREVGHEYKGGRPEKGRAGVVIGPRNFGSFRMRGRPIADRFSWKELNSRSKITVESPDRFDVAFVVKAGVPPVIREKSDRVIWEPVDLWFGDHRSAEMSPKDWLLSQWKAHRFDEIIVSTVPLKDAADRVLKPEGVRVHLVPHHADPRVGLDWFDPDGPIVYAGAKEFIAPARGTIIEAAKKIGRELVLDHDHHSWKALEGAALVLAPRLALRTRMNVLGKPTVKVANAAQAGIPVLATPDPAIAGLFPDVLGLEVDRWSNVESLAKTFDYALGSPPSICKFPAERWLERMKEIIG